MQELERWQQDALPEYGSAKRAHAQLGPDAATLTRMLARMDEALVAPEQTGPRTPAGVRKAWPWLVPLLALLAATGWLVRETRSAPPRALHEPGGVLPSVRIAPPVPSTEAPARVQPADPAPAKAPRRALVAPDPVAELALLERARRILPRDPARTLALTDEHRRTFRAPGFVEERELLAIDALLRMSRRAAAEQRALAFRRSHPDSVHKHRLEVMLRAEER